MALYEHRFQRSFPSGEKYQICKKQFKERLERGDISEFYILNKSWYQTWKKTTPSYLTQKKMNDILTLNDKIQEQPTKIENGCLGDIIVVKTCYTNYNNIFNPSGRNLFYIDYCSIEELNKIKELVIIKEEKKNNIKIISKEMWQYFLNIFKGGLEIRRFVDSDALRIANKKKIHLYNYIIIKCLPVYIISSYDNFKFDYDNFIKQKNFFYIGNGVNVTKIKESIVKIIFKKFKIYYCRIWKIKKDNKDIFFRFMKENEKYFNMNIPVHFSQSILKIIQLVDSIPLYTNFDDSDILFVEIILDDIHKSFFSLYENKHYIPNTICSICNRKRNLFLTCFCKTEWVCSIKCYKKFLLKGTHKCYIAKENKIPNKTNSFQLSKESLKGLVGIKNLGNTCYMNAAIQCLSNIHEFTAFFLNKNLTSFSQGFNKGKVLFQFANVLKKLHFGKEKSISINNFRMSIGERNNIFLGNNQEDAEEFLLSLLDELHEEMNPQSKKRRNTLLKEESTTHGSSSNNTMKNNNKKEQSNDGDNGEKELINFLLNNQTIISNLFVGQFRSSVQCFNCNKINHSFDIFSCISLPIPILNEISIVVYFVFFDINKGILELPITIESEMLFIDLRNIISGMLNVHQMSFIICILENNKIERIYNCSMPIKDVFPNSNSQNEKMLFCFQFDTNLNDNDNKFFHKKEIGSMENSTDNNTAISGKINKNYKKMGLSDLKCEKLETFYTQVDPSFLELYSCDDALLKGTEYYQVIHNIDISLNNSNISNRTIREQAKRLILNTISTSLLVYTDENYGFNENYIKVFINFKEYYNDYFPNKEKKELFFIKRTPIAFQRIIYIDIKWSIQYLINYLSKNFSYDGNIPDIRIVNVNKNKFNKKCFICGERDCNDCILSTSNKISTVEDIINLYPTHPKNKNVKIDNSYLYFDVSQRKMLIPRCDFELELTYNKPTNKIENILLLTYTNANQRKNFNKKTNAKIDIYDCLKKFSKKEILDENNFWYCSQCKKNQKAIKKIKINYPPEITIIQLKRFKNGGNVKIDNYIDVPICGFKMKSFNVTELYDLIGIINHYGSIGFGHYTAVCLNYYNGKWYKFDDSKVSEVEEKNIITNSAYILFFKKRGFDLEKADSFYNGKLKYIDEVKKNFKKFKINYIKGEEGKLQGENFNEVK